MRELLRLSLISPTESFYYQGGDHQVKIGRSHNCEFSIPKEDLSREHCLVEMSPDGFFITDLGSRNGVVVDRKKILANTKTKVSMDSHILLANIYTLKINPSDFDSKKAQANKNKSDSNTTTFEFSPEEKSSLLGQVKTLLKSHEGRNEKAEMLKMAVGFLIILGFVIYQVLGR